MNTDQGSQYSGAGWITTLTQSDIPIKQEVIVESIVQFYEEGNPRTDAVTGDDRKYSQWYDRNTLWLYSRGQNS